MSAPLTASPAFDFIQWLRDYAWVKTKRGWVPMVITEGQEKAIRELGFFALTVGWWASVKGRAVGFTTLCILWSIWYCSTHPGAVVVWIIPTDGFHSKILAQFREMVLKLQTEGVPGLEQGIYPDNANVAGFANGARIEWEVVGGTRGTADAVGRARPIDAVICTEFGYPIEPMYLEVAIDALKPALERRGAPVLIDSTPNGDVGPGRVYFELVGDILASRLPGGVFLFGWWMEPDYKDPVGDEAALIASYTVEEIRLVALHGWKPGQVAWRRRKRGTTPAQHAKFAEDYPEDIESAFVPKGGDYIVDQGLIRQARRMLRDGSAVQPMSSGELESAGLKRCGPDDPAHWGEGKGDRGFCRVFQPPRAAGRGWGALDCSDGLAGSDWQSFTVVDELGRVACFFYLRIDPIRVGALVQRLAEWYGLEELTIESQHAEPALGVIRRAVTWDAAQVKGASAEELEVLKRPYVGRLKSQHTGEGVHDEAMDYALRLYGEAHLIVDAVIAQELEDLRRIDGRLKARSGAHDDGLMSGGLAERARRRSMLREAGRGGGGGGRGSKRGKGEGGGEFRAGRVKQKRYGYLRD